MLKMALTMTVILASGVAYALDNSDLIQLNLRMSQQQELQQPHVPQLPEPAEQAKLQQREYLRELLEQRQDEQIKQKNYLQHLLFEWQRRQESKRLVEKRKLELLPQREQSGLFQ